MVKGKLSKQGLAIEPVFEKDSKTGAFVINKRGTRLSDHALFHSIIDAIETPTVILTADLNIITWNKPASEDTILFKDNNLISDRPLENFIAESYYNIIHSSLEEVSKGNIVDREFSDDNKHFYNLRLRPIMNHRNNFLGLMFSFRDSSSQISTFLGAFNDISVNSIFTQVAVGVMLFDLNLKQITANRKFYEMMGVSEEEWNSYQSIWNVTHPDDRRKSRNMAKKLASGEIDNYSLEKRYIHSSGRIFWVQLTATLARNDEGKPNYIISVVQDITKRKKVEENLRFKKNELDMFVYRISHDLKGPVASMMGLHNLVQHEFKDNKQLSPYFTHYQDNIERLHGIIHNLLSLARMKDAKSNPEPIQLNDFIENIIKSLHHQPNIKHIRVENKISVDIVIHTDRNHLITVLQNLIENALKYNHTRVDPFVVITHHRENDCDVIEVIDNGEGIPPEMQEKVFDMFSRNSTDTDGTGLGLYLVKNAAEKIDGQIELTSKVGVGTKFSLILPSNT